MKIPEIRSSITEIQKQLEDFNDRLEAQKALLIGVLSMGGEGLEERFLVIRDQVKRQNPRAAKQIDHIIASVHRPGRKHQ